MFTGIYYKVPVPKSQSSPPPPPKSEALYIGNYFLLAPRFFYQSQLSGREPKVIIVNVTLAES